MTIRLYSQGQEIQLGGARGISLSEVVGEEVQPFPQFMFDIQNTGAPSGRVVPDSNPPVFLSISAWDDSINFACIADNTVFSVGEDNVPGTGVAAHNAIDGSQQWKIFIGSASGVRGCSYNDGVVYAALDNFVWALDASDGSTIWQSANLGDFMDSTPAYHNGFIYTAAGNSVFKLDASDGTQDWSFNLGDSYTPNESTPAIDPDNSQVIAGHTNGDVFAIDITTGNQNWSNTSFASMEGGYTVADGAVFVGDGNPLGPWAVARLDLTDGTPDWNLNEPDGFIHVGFSFDGEGITYGVEDLLGGIMEFKRRDKDTGAVDWSVSMTDTPQSAWPVSADGLSLIGDINGNLYAVDTATGSLEYSYDVGDELLSLMVSSGLIYTTTAQSGDIDIRGELA